MVDTEGRPNIKAIKDAEEFQSWYWLKAELVDYARSLGIGYACQKPELIRRIAHWIDTGEAIKNKQKQTTSQFDWQTEILSKETVISDSYRNTRNVRAFMKEAVGDRFSFSNEFMCWMRKNTGKTLGDAVNYWLELERKKQTEGYREKALPQNQYNQFTRAISRAKPGITAKEIRRIWGIKRQGKGPHVYQKGDENK